MSEAMEPGRKQSTAEKSTQENKIKMLFAGAILLSIIAIFIAVLYFTKGFCSISEEECTDKFCVKAASALLDFIDTKEDPCLNFYHFTCGHYMRNAVKKGATTPVVEIETEFTNELKSFIVDPINKRKDSEAQRSMKKFYRVCMNESAIEDDGDRTFMGIIDQLGGWPLVNGTSWDGNKVNWVDWYVVSVKLGLATRGFFEFKQAIVDGNRTVLRISGADTSRLDKNNYESAFKEIARWFGAHDKVGNAIFETYDLLKRIRKLSEQIIEEVDRNEEISNIDGLYNVCPQFPWLDIISGLSEGIRNIRNDTEVLYGTMKEYCKGLDSLILSTPKKTIINFFIGQILERSRYYLSRTVRRAFEDFKKESDNRFNVCFSETDSRFQYLKETLYVRTKTSPKVKAQLEEMIENIKEVYLEHFRKSTWMDEETIERAIDKAKLVEKVIGAEDILYDEEKFDKFLGVDGLEFNTDNAFEILTEKNRRDNRHLWELLYIDSPDNWRSFFRTANKVNAFFLERLNVMVIPAPILSSVFYHHKMPMYMNYGAIGRVIGHEIMHGYGEAGRYVLLKNNKMINWWTNATADAFNETKQCVIKDYENTVFQYSNNNLNQFGGILTLEENIADFVGIDIAYEAYLRWEKKHGPEKKLPGVPLTPKQIFWVQTGTVLCFRKLDDEELDLNKPGDHAVPYYRATAGARNSLYFAKDFDCPIGSYMNPKNKCRIL